MRWPRFTILQLFLVTALVGLLVGWWMQSRLVGKQSLLTALAISPDGTKVAANYSSGIVDVWDISGSASRKLLALGPTRGLLHEARFLDDGAIMMTRYANQGTELVRYDPQTKRETVVVKSRTPWHKWCVSHDGKVAASCGAPMTVDIWKLTTGKLIHQQTIPGGAGDFVNRLDLDTSGTMIAASVPSKSQVHLIDVATGRKRVIPSQMSHASSALAADGKSLIVVDWRPPPSWGPEIIVIDPTDLTSQPRCQFTSQMFLRSVQVSRDGSRILLSSFERMAVWDVPPPKQRWQFDKPTSLSQRWSRDFSMLLDQGALSADGSRVVRSAGPDGIVVLDAGTGQRLMNIGGTQRLRDSFLYSAAFLGWAVAWGLVSRREKLRQPAATPAPAMPTFGFRLQAQELVTAIQAPEQPHEPWRLAVARILMGAGGVWGIVFAVAASFYSSTLAMPADAGNCAADWNTGNGSCRGGGIGGDCVRPPDYKSRRSSAATRFSRRWGSRPRRRSAETT